MTQYPPYPIYGNKLMNQQIPWFTGNPYKCFTRAVRQKSAGIFSTMDSLSVTALREASKMCHDIWLFSHQQQRGLL